MLSMLLANVQGLHRRQPHITCSAKLSCAERGSLIEVK